MKATRELIDALRLTADRIENKQYQFRWHNNVNCYCGCLARTVMDLSELEFELIRVSDLHIDGSTWTEKAANVERCQTTGIPISDIFSTLYSIGLTAPEDLEEIEYLGLGRPSVVEEPCDYAARTGITQPEMGINWMRRKADQLETQLLSQQALTSQAVTTQPVTLN